MVLGASGLDAFAKTEEDVSKTETNTSGIEANKSYLVPLTFYDVTGESIRDYGGLGGIPEFIDNVAIVSKNSDDTYHVTLQIETVSYTHLAVQNRKKEKQQADYCSQQHWHVC